MDKTYSTSSYMEDLQEIRDSEKVSYDDIELLTKYIALSEVAGNQLQGRSYEEILESIKKVRDAQMTEATAADLKIESARERMRPYLAVNIKEKIFSRIDNRDCIRYTILFKNTSSKKIKMLVGSVSINDLLDREIKNIPVVWDEQLPANATLRKVYNIDYDHGSENDRHVRTKDLTDLRVLWNPVKIIFEDGTIAD